MPSHFFSFWPHFLATEPMTRKRRASGRSAEGYRATIVGGEVTYRDGAFTGAMPGRLVRGARLSDGRSTG
jgi:N-acyl-D-aspartate/D-glutamate deacylase